MKTKAPFYAFFSPLFFSLLIFFAADFFRRSASMFRTAHTQEKFEFFSSAKEIMAIFQRFSGLKIQNLFLKLHFFFKFMTSRVDIFLQCFHGWTFEVFAI